MLIVPIQCALDYVLALNEMLKKIAPSHLSKSQRRWFSVILTGLIVAGELNWASFERKSLGKFKESWLRWFFRYAQIPWMYLLQASIGMVLSHYKLEEGVIVLDDSDKMRSKNTKKIAHVHTVKDKKTGGWFKGQEFVFMILVTKSVTIPLGFRFYSPDPARREWRKKVKAEKKLGVPAKLRTKCPERNPSYPSKQELALDLIRTFKKHHPAVKIQAILADALYCTDYFMEEASKAGSCKQVISQLRKNQLVRNRSGKNTAVKTYFERSSGVETTLTIRGGEEKKVTMLAARLVVKAHGKKRFVIALKYEGETEYRFIVARDITWRHKDVVLTYTLRWLVEVFIADWKMHCGWNTLSKQQGDEAATQGVTLSLLCDHLLILHPKQSALIKNKQPAMSVGCMIEHINAEALINGISDIVNAEEPKAEFDRFKTLMSNVLPIRQSKKHMNGRDLGRMEPTPSLKYQAAA